MTASVAILPADRDGFERDVTAGGGVVSSADQADAIIYTDARDPGLLAEVLASSPARWIQLPFAGVEPFFDAGVIDDAHIWTCAKGIYGESTAEHALALLLACARSLPHHARTRRWKPTGDERRLGDATILVVGTGGIGRALTAMLGPLGARVVAVNRSGRPLAGALRTEPVSRIGELVRAADFIVLALALTGETHNLFGPDLLSDMKPGAWLVNVGRGGLVDTGALVDALRAESIGGAALDVTDPEPLPAEHPLWSLDNALVTPHVANTWSMALPELRGLIRRNVERFAQGAELEGVVDPELGY
jgi:phosphoglycerate dehydrogenase-like enzyme